MAIPNRQNAKLIQRNLILCLKTKAILIAVLVTVSSSTPALIAQGFECIACESFEDCGNGFACVSYLRIFTGEACTTCAEAVPRPAEIDALIFGDSRFRNPNQACTKNGSGVAPTATLGNDGNASVLLGNPSGETCVAEPPVIGGKVEAYISELVAFEGELAVDGIGEGPTKSLCYNLVVTNPLTEAQSFVMQFDMPVDAFDVPYTSDTILFSVLEDDESGLAEIVPIGEEIQQLSGVGDFGGTGRLDGPNLGAEITSNGPILATLFNADAEVGPPPFDNEYVGLTFFLAFELSPLDTVNLRGKAIVEVDGGGGEVCQTPVLRDGPGTVFQDRFETGDVSLWSSAQP